MVLSSGATTQTEPEGRGHWTRKARFSPAHSGTRTTLSCSGWRDEAVELFDFLLTLCNDVGLLSEEYDPVAGAHAGGTSRRPFPMSR